ncbi:MBL fold metallo-hydrolase [bacterium]|nr:MBL fold metallo-hydrolase [bacterium]
MSVAFGYKISQLVAEEFWLDGGAMFGSVPKTLWSKLITVDDQNRIQLCTRLLLLESSASSNPRRALIDVGCGDKWSDKERAIFKIHSKLKADLEEVVGNPTDIILTHLHFDHAGGITKRLEDGTTKRRFLHQRVFVSEKNFKHACAPGPRERASYLQENIEPLLQGPLEFCVDGKEVLPNVFVFQSNGHTPGLQWVRVGYGKGSIAFPADLIPTSRHLQIPYVMGYDLCAQSTMDEKAQFLNQAVEEEWVIVFEHDPDVAAAIIHRDEKGRFAIKERVDLPTIT